MNQLNFSMRELKPSGLASLTLPARWTCLYLILPSPPQRPGQRGSVRFGDWRRGRRGSADPLHPAAVLLLRERPHHPESVRSAAAPTAAERCGCQQKPGRARRLPLHAGYGELTHHKSSLLSNSKGNLEFIIIDYFHAMAKELQHLFKQFSPS